MNLTRMREFNLEGYCSVAYQIYKDRIEYLDQDIYNIVFNSYPGKIIVALKQGSQSVTSLVG